MSWVRREVERWDNEPQMIRCVRASTVGVMRRVRCAIVIVLATVTCVALMWSPQTSASAAASSPDSLSHLGNAHQVIIVTASGWSSPAGTLTAWERDAHGWRRVIAPTPAVLGARGLVLASQRRQSTGTTPAGTFAIPSSFGRLPNPGTGLPYTQLTPKDAWPYNPDDPSTYNVFQDADRSWDSYGHNVEYLWRHGVQYDYVAVLDYNLPRGSITTDANGIRHATTPANTAAGGGIFLHVSDGRKTTGCIAVSRKAMRSILRWLNPAAQPVIVVGPQSQINQM